MSHKLLTVKDLHVNVGEKEILHGVNLQVGKGETHVLMGPNGTGKSTLGYAIAEIPVTKSQKEAFCLTEKILLICRSTKELRKEFSFPSRTLWKYRA